MKTLQKLQEQRRLLQIEYEEEKKDFEKISREMGVERMVKRGDAWWPVRITKSYYNSLNQACAELVRDLPDDEDISHNFEYSRPVVFFRKDDQAKFLNIRGTVSYAESDRMVVAFDSMAQVQQLRDMSKTAQVQQLRDMSKMASDGADSAAGGIGVQLFFDETTYQLMFEALDRVIKAKDDRLAYLRDLIYSETLPAQKYNLAPLRFTWLNETQESAVNELLRAKDVMVVHGPPGTGKTTTLVEAIDETLKRETQVLVCAQSNMAVDWISEKLVDRGISVLRIGNPVRVNDKMLSFTYERSFEAHPDYPQLWAIRRSIRQMRSSRNRDHNKLRNLQEKATQLELSIRESLFLNARVIACTLTSSASKPMMGLKFDTLFIDEAAQALEAACWIAISRARRVVLAGDHCQLPPTVKSYEAMKHGLGRSLMERIVQNKPDCVKLLQMQYRANEQIMQFSSDWFYGGKVQSHPSVRYRELVNFDDPMVWVDSHSDEGFGEVFVGQNFGRLNKGEAELALTQLRTYFEEIGLQRILDEQVDVGIISPYRAQVQYLRQRVRQSDFFKPFRHLISVNTVDGFQGQERDIIVISLVRSNEKAQIGFLSDLRRMNVAITRARMKLMICGDVETLCRHKFYSQLHAQCVKV